MSKLIYSVEEVFSNYLTNEQLYNIPEYQRGFKWSSQQIEQLLNDINDFDTKGDNELFYCLQNITLVEKEKKINIVDGQQRLTTLALLLAFLGKKELIENKLVYSVRESSNEFLQKIIRNDEDRFLDNILGSKDFDSFVEETKGHNDFQDIYFMYSAVRTIGQWFNKLENADFKKIFTNKLLKNVKLIVNRIEGVSEQELFMNLNTGRVQLDGADLVRAILITRVAKQEMEEYDSNETKDVVRLNERRIRIGWELDEINAWWSKEEVKEYFRTFTKLKTGEKETIDFNHNIHPINLLYRIWVEQEGEKEIRLSLFEAKSLPALDIYLSITLLHRTLKDWFEDRVIYHYLGFLFSQKRDFQFKKVWESWNTADKKEFFVKYLKNNIQRFVFGKENADDTGAENWLLKLKDYDSKNATNWYDTPELEKILLTLDMIEHSSEKDNGIPLPFLKPKYFKNHKEDKEHIYPSTPKDIKEISELKDPKKSFDDYIKRLNDGSKKERQIEWTYPSDWNILPDNEKEIKLLELKNEIHKKCPINSIGNLVLLHLSINRSFGNDYYSEKRITVINNAEKGEYIRQHTLKVFVKQTQSTDLNNWAMKDIKQNADEIHDSLKKFFEINTKEI